MRALVTGGAGFIGSHTADLLLREGYRVRVLDNLSPPVHHDGRVPSYLNPDIEFMRGDVRNREDWEKALEDVDYVFHLAAYQDYLPDFSKFIDVNCVGTALLYELIVEKSYPIKKVVVASSQSVYGEGHYECSEHGTHFPHQRSREQMQQAAWNVICPECGQVMESRRTDEAVVNCHNQYAISKYTQELISLRLGKRHGIPTVAMRYSITQGPRQSPHNAYSGILRIFTTRLLNGLAPIVYEDGQQLRDYGSVFDVARANFLVMQDPRADYEAFNVGSGEPITVLQYAERLMETVGVDYEPLVLGQFRVGDTRHIVSDVDKLRGCGWEPRVPLPEIMAQYVGWVRESRAAHRSYLEADRIMQAAGVVQNSQP